MSCAEYPPVKLELVPSRWLLAGIGVCHLLALGSLLFIAGELSIKIALAVLVAVSLIDGLLRYGCPRHFRYIERVYFSAGGAWTVCSAGGREQPAVLSSSYVHTHLLILVFATGRFARQAVVIPADAADPDEHRRLRLLLRAGDAGNGAGRPANRGMA